jgi:hypothetical protein
MQAIAFAHLGHSPFSIPRSSLKLRPMRDDNRLTFFQTLSVKTLTSETLQFESSSLEAASYDFHSSLRIFCVKGLEFRILVGCLNYRNL